MRLRHQRHALQHLLNNPDRLCVSDPSRWDDNLDQGQTRALCKGCPLTVECGTVAVIDEALVLADSERHTINARNWVVSGTRGGVTARVRRPTVRALADRIIIERMARAEKACANAERKSQTAKAAKAGTAS
ncbi:hypothetical protein FXF51_02260 [Nonomuraea sp. PA05]|uniref:hypothetical protein n=1 Tax=Nonomuraea sp. PA05 TaxID=2604466 RepID=UPI0011D9554D|nr:hypothetical protein [Nonomuraea sp. PA05]TYB71277.1 hypothetical protein FXF51_02260 [Nonomuraea sp. PA05]